MWIKSEVYNKYIYIFFKENRILLSLLYLERPYDSTRDFAIQDVHLSS